MKNLRPLLVLVLALISTSSLVTPPPADAIICVCDPTLNTTPTAGCAAADCTAAQNCLSSYLRNYAQGECGNILCYQRLVITDSCFASGPTSYQVNGYLEYKCRDCG